MAERRMVGDVAIPTLVEAAQDPRFFGVELTPRQRGLLEQVELGFLLHVWALGRRSGKTLMAVLIALHFCVLRPDLASYVRRREKRYAVAVATSLRQSRIFVEQARSIVEASPFLAKFVESVTDDAIHFKNRTALAAFPATARGGRGWPIMCLLQDEAAHQLDGEGNQAGDQIFRSLAPSVAQFGGEGRIIVASSPFGTDGFFADLFHRVERAEIENAIAARASTLAMRPGFETAALELERQRDPDGYRSEYEALFVPAGAGFLDPARVAADRMHELAPGEVVAPVGAIDLGFVHDATALVIVGRDRDEHRRLRVVLARSWKPDVRSPLGFTPVLDEIADLCLAQGVTRVFCDQHHAVAATEHLARRGIHATSVATTAQSKSDMFADLKTRLYAGAVELYDQPELLAELRRIETVTTPGAATVRIPRLGSSHGDLATALALACSKLRDVAAMRSHVPHGRIPTSSVATGRTYADRVAEQRRTQYRRPGHDALEARLGLPRT